jgi:hypothetical protein
MFKTIEAGRLFCSHPEQDGCGFTLSFEVAGYSVFCLNNQPVETAEGRMKPSVVAGVLIRVLQTEQSLFKSQLSTDDMDAAHFSVWMWESGYGALVEREALPLVR